MSRPFARTRLAAAPLRRLGPTLALACGAAVGLLAPASRAALGPRLDVVAEFPNRQVTGIAVAADGRIFVNFPDWSDTHTLSVAELGRDGRLSAYPDAAWNAPDGAAEGRFVCVQSVYAGEPGVLWVLDAGSPKMRGVIPGGAKLVKIDLARDEAAQVIPFATEIAPPKSYFNDVRVDTAHGFAFITDSGLGALVVVNLRSGGVRRLLDDHPSVKPEPGVQLAVEGNRLIDLDTGQPPAIAADGLALDEQGGYLYYKALTAHTLYRVPVAALESERTSAADLAATVEKVGSVPASDGLAFRGGRVYLTAIEDNAIVRYVVGQGTAEEWVEDDRLKWPDSLAWGPDGSLYVTTSQIHLTPRFNQGVSRVREPFRLFKIAVSDPLSP